MAVEEAERVETEKFVTFGLEREQFGIEVLEVQEIIAEFSITALPRAPQYIAGVISLRGTIVPVVDLRERFDLSLKEKDLKTRVVVVNVKDETIGMIVDEVFEVVAISRDTIEEPPPIISSLGLAAEYLSGVTLVNEKLLIVLDLEKTLAGVKTDTVKAVGT